MFIKYKCIYLNVTKNLKIADNSLRHIYARIQIYLKRLSSHTYTLIYNLYKDLKSKYKTCYLAEAN